MQQSSIQRAAAKRVPEARYAYYRRCQAFRRNGEQCKAPAEKGVQICHAHAGQQMTAQRRERERRAVLAEAVAEMRRRGKAECEMADLLMDFKGIQVTLAVMAQALIDGRIDCKTAGRLAVELQTMSKLLWMMHKGRKTLPLMNPDSTDLKEVHAGKNWAANQGEKTRIPEKVLSMKDTKEHEGSVRIAVVTEIRAVADSHGCRDGPPEWAEAA